MIRDRVVMGPPEDVREELTTNHRRVRGSYNASRLWNHHFSREEKRRLGNDVESAYLDGGTIGMWKRLHGVSTVRAVIDVAKVLSYVDENTQRWLLRATGEDSDEPEEWLEFALERASLVLTERPRQVYWMGSKLEVEWEKCPKVWEYFFTLCECSKRGQDVDAADFGEHRRPDWHIKMKSRLTTDTPGFVFDLGNRIESERGGIQRLTVSPQGIRILYAHLGDRWN